MKDFILKRTPNKLLPKGKKSKSPRNQVCRVNKDGPIVYLLYLKFTNHLPLDEKETQLGGGLTKHDYAGIFQTREDARYVADCLNKIFKWYHVYDDQYKLTSPYVVTRRNTYLMRKNPYFIVHGYYRMIGNVRRKQFMTEKLMGIVSDKAELQHYKELYLHEAQGNINMYLRKIFPDNINKIHMEPTIHVVRYKLNDVMPTMNLDDYSIQQHKQHMQKITDELSKYPHNKAMKILIGELKYLPPTKPLKQGGIEYQKLVNDPEFQKRWSK